MKYAVILDSPDLAFRATHFVAFPQSDSELWFGEEPHEHSFKVAARIEGPLDASDCVVDFVAAKERLTDVLAELDGKTLLASLVPNAAYSGNVATDTIEIVWNGAPARAKYTAPASRVVWFDAANASAEIIAQHILKEWFARLDLSLAREKYCASLRLEEAPGAFVEVSF